MWLHHYCKLIALQNHKIALPRYHAKCDMHIALHNTFGYSAPGYFRYRRIRKPTLSLISQRMRGRLLFEHTRRYEPGNKGLGVMGFG